MFLRRYTRTKDGKTHTYYALVESVRTAAEVVLISPGCADSGGFCPKTETNSPDFLGFS